MTEVIEDVFAVQNIIRKGDIKIYNYNGYSPQKIQELLNVYLGHLDIIKHPKKGDVLKGTLIGVLGNSILVDVNYKDFVFVGNQKSELLALEIIDKKIGDTVKVLVTDVTNNPFIISGSFIELAKQQAHEDIIKNSDKHVLMGKVLDWNPAGYNVEVTFDTHKMKAFMPNTLAGVNKLSNPHSIVGKDLEVMIDTQQSSSDDFTSFIVSRRKYLLTLKPKVLENLKITDDSGKPIEYEGVVTGTASFAVFVEMMECLTGMIHVSCLTDELKQNFNKVQPGDKIKFYVKENIQGKLILSQIYKPTLWDEINPGKVFEGRVVKSQTKIGLLISLDNETQGLIHNSEIEKCSRNITIGDVVDVKILAFSRLERKIFLSIEDGKKSNKKK